MRARRRFQPILDSMPIRIAPSSISGTTPAVVQTAATSVSTVPHDLPCDTLMPGGERCLRSSSNRSRHHILFHARFVRVAGMVLETHSELTRGISRSTLRNSATIAPTRSSINCAGELRRSNGDGGKLAFGFIKIAMAEMRRIFSINHDSTPNLSPWITQTNYLRGGVLVIPTIFCENNLVSATTR